MQTAQPLAYMLPDFLESDEARPIRILAEYLEPHRRFRKERIRDTVVFFGSARIRSREAAARQLAALDRGELNGLSEREARALAARSLEWSRYYEDARELARRLTTWSKTLPGKCARFVKAKGIELVGEITDGELSAVGGVWREDAPKIESDEEHE